MKAVNLVILGINMIRILHELGLKYRKQNHANYQFMNSYFSGVLVTVLKVHRGHGGKVLQILDLRITLGWHQPLHIHNIYTSDRRNNCILQYSCTNRPC
jgi:hypothetical protein